MVAVGDLARLAGETAAERGVAVARTGSATEAVEALGGRLTAGDVVLVKGSRVMHLEDVVKGLTVDA
jgi:UDP-N-acetylmuramyl pentapeptide synthase